MKTLKTFLILILFSGVLLAQKQTIPLDKLGLFPDTVVNYSQNRGKVVLTMDKQLREILLNYNSAFKEKKIIGWRVQIFFDSGSGASNRARNVINNFKLKHPDIPAYLEYEEPFFKVRVGNFLTKLEAAKFKLKLEQEGYDKVFLVEEEINITR